MGRAKAYRYKGGSSYSFNKYDKDFVLVDFETPSVPTASFIDFEPGDNFSQKGFEFESFINGVDASVSPVQDAGDEILYNNTSTGLNTSAIAALNKFGFTGKNGQPNQSLAPNFFGSDLEVTYFEKDKWNEPAERENFRFKGLFASAYDLWNALDNVTLTFTGYRDGDKEFEFTKTVASGGFIKSNYRDKIDRLVITDGINGGDKDFVIDNFMAEV